MKKIKSFVRKKLQQNVILNKYRLHEIIQGQNEMASHWKSMIEKYEKNEIYKFEFKKKVTFDSKKIIWQFWAQGNNYNDLPDIVQLCYKSVDQYCDDYTVIRLSMDNISDFIDLPEFVYRKLNTSNFTYTFFSDLLRVILLNVYGGVWLDATILLTDHLSKFKYVQSDFFSFERSSSKPKNYKFFERTLMQYWSWDKNFKVRFLSSFMICNSDSEILKYCQDLLLNYWETQKENQHYFSFQILYNEILINVPEIDDRNTEADHFAHFLHNKIVNSNFDMSFDEILQKSSIHKLTYIDDEKMKILKTVLAK